MSKSGVGVDIGSRMIKILRLDGDTRADTHIFSTGHNPISAIQEVIDKIGVESSHIVATGYGRHLAQKHFSFRTITEITACARGARMVCPDCDSVIDIGGQDSKAIELLPEGKFGRFEMNDRCAAGTGRFIEVMAAVLGYSLEEFSEEAMKADLPAPINSLCTVFAESEVVSLIAQGEDRSRIALGLHVSLAGRVAAMTSRLELGRKTLFVGGVARDRCMSESLCEYLPSEMVVPEMPEFVVAAGAAAIARDG